MAATLVDEFDEDAQEVTSPQTPAQEPARPAPLVLDGDDVPEKLRGKSVTDLLALYQEAERQIGRQANEVGTLRSLVDQILEVKPGHASRPAKPEPQAETIDTDTLLADPHGAVTRAASQATRPLEDKIAQLERLEAQRAFLAAHPTAQRDANDPAFIDWVKGNKARTKLGQKAFPPDGPPDFEAADDLWALWEEQRRTAAPTEPAPEVTPASPEQPAPTVKTSPPKLLGGGGGNDPGAASSQRTFSRAKLLKLQMEKPDEYYDPAFQQELMQAYREGRVK